MLFLSSLFQIQDFLMIAYKESLLFKEEILRCIEVLKVSGRHISGKLYEQLIEKISD